MNRCLCCGMLTCRHCGQPIERFDVGYSHYLVDEAGKRSYRNRCPEPDTTMAEP